MAERPKLERLSEWLQAEDSAGKYTLAHANLELLLRYCRELEAENKRLRVDIDEYSHTPEPEMGPWS